MNDQASLFEAKHARDEALARVTANGGAWIERAIAAIYLLAPFEGTFEDIRIAVLRQGLREPHHHNAWGAVARAAEIRGIIIRTGAFRNMRTRKSHARQTPVYRVKMPGG